MYFYSVFFWPKYEYNFPFFPMHLILLFNSDCTSFFSQFFPVAVCFSCRNITRLAHYQAGIPHKPWLLMTKLFQLTKQLRENSIQFKMQNAIMLVYNAVWSICCQVNQSCHPFVSVLLSVQTHCLLWFSDLIRPALSLPLCQRAVEWGVMLYRVSAGFTNLNLRI